MANDDDNDGLSKEEQEKLDSLDWSDITNELIRNKEMVRAGAPSKKQASSASLDLELLYDLPLHLKVEVGRKKAVVNEVLSYRIGSIVELENAVGSSLEIYINDVLIGYGKIIEANKKYGIKITHILNAEERLEILHSKSSEY